MAAPKKKAAPISSNAVISDTDGAINAIYDQLAGHLASGTGAQGQNFHRARQLVGSSFDQADQLATAGARATMGGLREQLGRLGLGAAEDSVTQGVRNQLNQGLTSAARRKMNELSTMGQQQAGYEMASRLGVDNSRQQQALVRGESVTEIQEALANMEAARAEAQGKVDVARIQGQAELASLRAQHAAASRAAAQGDPLADLKAQSLGMDILLKEKKLNDPGKGEKGATKYQAGLDNYLDSIQASPAFKARVMSMYDTANNQAASPANGALNRDDPYEWAMTGVSNYNSGANKDRLRQALQIMYGKV